MASYNTFKSQSIKQTNSNINRNINRRCTKVFSYLTILTLFLCSFNTVKAYDNYNLGMS